MEKTRKNDVPRVNWRRRTVVTVIGSALLAGLCAAAYMKGREQALNQGGSLHVGTLLAEVSTLEMLRQGDTTAALRRLEVHVSALALELLRDNNGTRSDSFRMAIEGVTNYRERFRIAPGSATPAERQLQEVLQQEAGRSAGR